MLDIVSTERKVVGTNCYGVLSQSFRAEFNAIIQALAAGNIDADPFITGRIDLKNLTEEGFEKLLDFETPRKSWSSRSPFPSRPTIDKLIIYTRYLNRRHNGAPQVRSGRVNDDDSTVYLSGDDLRERAVRRPDRPRRRTRLRYR